MKMVFALMSAQVVLGAFDNLWHHEITERLPAKRSAAGELSLHSAREALYGFLFFALAWYEWRGPWALLIGAAVLSEIAITIADFLVEDRTRRLPPFERVLHTILAISIGLVIAALVPVLMRWAAMPAEIAPVHYGPVSWMFTVFAAGVSAWSVRNLLAVLKHRRPPEWMRNPIVPGTNEARRTILISGATGFIGGHLVRRLVTRGDQVIVFTRNPEHAHDRFGPHVRIVQNLESIDASTRIDAIINLAGAPVVGIPWTQARRRTLLASRTGPTRALADLCTRLIRAPKVFINASAIGYYGVRGNERLNERAEPQTIFQSHLCRERENAALAVEGLGTRLVQLRFGLVLGRDGGALPPLALPVRLGAGAILGSGKQWVSWIHIDDVVRLIELSLDAPMLHGPVNAVAPHPATHRQMQRAIARTLHRPLWFRVPAFMLRTVMGEMAQIFVDGQRVVPTKALTAGFAFRHRYIGPAIQNLLSTRIEI
jgi:uncharacterized protein (TIGR01777 family)